jgi:hypothetical protein
MLSTLFFCIRIPLQRKRAMQEPAVEQLQGIQQEDSGGACTTCTSTSWTTSTAATTAGPAAALTPTAASLMDKFVTTAWSAPATAATATAAAAPAHGSSLMSALQADVVSDVATSCDLQLLTELMHAGYVLSEVIEWQRQLKMHSDTPITVDNTLSALSQWSRYYAQQQLSPGCSYYKQQQYAARVPQLEHLIKELECVRTACDSDCTAANCSDRSILSQWSVAVIRTSQQAHARLQQVRAAAVFQNYTAASVSVTTDSKHAWL